MGKIVGFFCVDTQLLSIRNALHKERQMDTKKYVKKVCRLQTFIWLSINFKFRYNLNIHRHHFFIEKLLWTKLLIFAEYNFLRSGLLLSGELVVVSCHSGSVATVQWPQLCWPGPCVQHEHWRGLRLQSRRHHSQLLLHHLPWLDPVLCWQEGKGMFNSFTFLS